MRYIANRKEKKKNYSLTQGVYRRANQSYNIVSW